MSADNAQYPLFPGITLSALIELLCLQPAVSQICSALEDADRQRAMRATLPWLEILALVLQQQGGQQGDAACPVLGEDPKLKESMSEALRCAVIFTSHL